MKQKVVLGLGSNSGDRRFWLRKAVRAIKNLPSNQLKILKHSAVYQSEAMLPENAPREWDEHFLNLCVLCETTLTPPALLKLVKDLEKTLGRKQHQFWGPREIDIDILAFGEDTFSSAELSIPHPGLLERPFAALPFCDVWPDWKIPSLKTSMAQYCKKWSLWSQESGPFETQKTPLSLTELVGILNLTPDSFSDGGKYNTVDKALEQFRSLCDQGATIIDVGAESTRPGAVLLDAESEWKRLEPFLKELSRLPFGQANPRPLLSIDTRHAEVAEKALAFGVEYINDISGISDARMVAVLNAAECKVIFMHSLSIPPNRNTIISDYTHPVQTVLDWAIPKRNALVDAGIHAERLIFDPGIGFGKTPRQNAAILEDVQQLHTLGLPLFIGHSRKSFLAQWFDRPAQERDPETAVFSQYLALQGVDYIRVHNVEASKRAIEAQMLLKNVTISFE